MKQIQFVGEVPRAPLSLGIPVQGAVQPSGSYATGINATNRNVSNAHLHDNDGVSLLLKKPKPSAQCVFNIKAPACLSRSRSTFSSGHTLFLSLNQSLLFCKYLYTEYFQCLLIFYDYILVSVILSSFVRSRKPLNYTNFTSRSTFLLIRFFNIFKFTYIPFY